MKQLQETEARHIMANGAVLIVDAPGGDDFPSWDKFIWDYWVERQNINTHREDAERALLDYVRENGAAGALTEEYVALLLDLDKWNKRTREHIPMYKDLSERYEKEHEAHLLSMFLEGRAHFLEDGVIPQQQ